MIPSRLAALFAGAALLSACAAGPDYQVPAAGVAEAGPFVAPAEGPFVAGQAPDDWWRLYEAPLLDAGDMSAAPDTAAADAAELESERLNDADLKDLGYQGGPSKG